MEFAVAQQSDLDELLSLYRAAIAHMDAQGVFQWDDIYPAQDVLEKDISLGEMEISLQNGRIAAAFTLNSRCDEEYALGAWRYPDARFCVLHRLCVHPVNQGQGVATQVMDHIERILLQRGYETVRLDAFSLNPSALRLYEKRGYKRVGEVQFRKGLFYFYEKLLSGDIPEQN